jgi:hypothetical protein
VIKSVNITGNSFSCLPRSLTFLDIHLGSVDDSRIGHLPSNLKSLHLVDAKTLTGKCFQNLPRSLTSLELPTLTSINDSDIGELPRALISLILPAVETLSDACGPLLPQNLKQFKIRGTDTSPTPVLVHYISKVGKVNLETAFFSKTLLDGKVIFDWKRPEPGSMSDYLM